MIVKKIVAQYKRSRFVKFTYQLVADWRSSSLHYIGQLRVEHDKLNRIGSFSTWALNVYEIFKET